MSFSFSSWLFIHFLFYSYFVGTGTFGVCCSIENLFPRRNITVIDANFTEICEDLGIITFRLCCLDENKLFMLP